MEAYKQTFIISRTDSIGDVVLTLPMAGILKREFPGCKVLFLGRTYTKALVESSVNINGFINVDDYTTHKELTKALAATKATCILHVFPNKNIAIAAQAAEIPMRVGTSHRLYHWYTCNYPVNFTRKNSNLHEGELNLKLLAPLGIQREFLADELPLYFGLTNVAPLPADKQEWLSPTKFNLILHPTSKGSAKEWGVDNFSNLVDLLPADRFKLFVTGTADDSEKLQAFTNQYADKVTNLTGKLTLTELISFIKQADGLVAASTGPLHITAALGRHAVGIYPSARPIHPGRWASLGKNAKVFVDETNAASTLAVKPEDVAEYLIGLAKQK